MPEQTVVVDKLALLRAIRHDCVTFLSFYLREELTLEVPDFHQEIWAELLQLLERLNREEVTITLRKLFAVPREHAKSTIAKLATILFLKYTNLSFVLYVSKTNGIAKNAIRDVIMWLQSEEETQLFGKMSIIKSSETESLWICDMLTRDEAGVQKVKRCIFRALGSEQQVRGLLINNRRPEIIIIDDVEDLDNTKDEAQQMTLDEWVIGSLMKARAKRAVVIFLGNMIRKTSLLARLSKNPEWNPTIFGCLVRDKKTGEIRPLWIGRHTVEDLLKDYKEHRLLGLGHVWECEMMNLTQDEVNMEDMSKVLLIPSPVAEQVTAGAIVLDPAYGLTQLSDESAITVHALLEDITIPVLIDSAHGRWNEERVFNEMLALSYHWNIFTWCVESDAAQKLWIGLFKVFFIQNNIPEDMILVLPINSGKTAKASRIVAFRDAVKAGAYGIAESQQEVVDRLGNYNPQGKDHDDLEDSAAYGSVIWQLHKTVITERGIQKLPMAVAAAETTSTSRSQFNTTAF